MPDSYYKFNEKKSISKFIHPFIPHDKYGIIEELEKHCAILFAEFEDTKEYRKLFNDLALHKKRIKRIYSSRSDLSNSDTYEEYRKSAEGILEMLEDNIPVLLSKTKFFKKAFY